jgi:HPt (histidine-containing phosphotransfer) domain-containing protein
MLKIGSMIEKILTTIYNVTEERYPDLILRTEVLGGIWFSLFGYLSFAVWIPIFLFIFDNVQAAASIALIGVPTSFLCVAVMRRTKNLSLATVILSYGNVINMVAISAVSGGAWSTAFAWIPLSIIGTFLTASSKSGIIMTVSSATLAGTVAFFVHPTNSSDWGFAFPILSAKHVYFNAVIQFGSLLSVGYFAYIFKAKQAAALVESEVAKKQVRSLLDHIPQGVVSIENRGRIAKDFSAHMDNILGKSLSPNMCFKELVLDHCEMASDDKDQTWQAILASVGENALNFELNKDKFPLQLCYKAEADAEPKYLKATWNALMEGDTVKRILVTLLDITDEKVLERESVAQKSTLELIQELINVPAQKMSQFFSTSIPLLKENLRILENEEVSITESTVRLLFVNAHTVKGAARTLQLKTLSTQIHRMEELYSGILKQGLPIERSKLRQDIHKTFEVLDAYKKVNRDKLNRSEDHDKVVIEREFIENHYFIMKNIIKENHVSVEKIISWLKEQSDALTNIIFEQLPAIFDGYKEKAARIARDIGKPEPKFEFSIDDISIGPDQRIVLDNCMIHLIRNALDHGLETADERRTARKKEQGVISIHASMKQDILTIVLHDDGRGLAMAQLREKGLRNGMIHANSKDQDIADIILAPGISTAHSVSDISGRGIGMNAVQTFLNKVDGHITIDLKEPKDPRGDYYDFRFVITMPVGKPIQLHESTAA